jgi:hypothetical protein
MKVRAIALVAGVLLLAPVMAGAATPQKAGKWQVKMTTEIPGMPFKMPPITTTVCLTEEDVANPEKSLPKDPKSDCKVSDYKIDGSTVSWTMACPKQKITGEGSITYDSESYSGQMKMNMDGTEMSQKYEGKYLGTCEKK